MWLLLAFCLQLFTRRAAALLAANQRLQRWCFDVELVWLADQLSIPTTEVRD
jgi:dolichyl-phosphate beta-glucosyltransferase